MIKKRILDIIKRHKRFLISAHINPDGDAIGSQLALANLLKAMGKTVRVINDQEVPRNLKLLPGLTQIECGLDNRQEDLKFDVAIILDSPDLSRIASIRKLLKKAYIINIDHHISNNHFGNLNWVDPKVSSVGEMVYGLYEYAHVAIKDESALSLYVAMMTDTGSFRFSNTAASTHKIIAKLLALDIKPAEVYEYIYQRKSLPTFKLLGEVLSNLQMSKDRKIVWFKVTNRMLKEKGLKSAATDDFVDFVRMIEGVEVVAFLREIDSAKAKVSLRSKSKVDVNKIAKYFGGGGHRLASGCVIEKNLPAAEKLLLSRIKKSIGKS